MFSKITVLFAALAVAQASLVGYGAAPLAAVGTLGLGKGIAVGATQSAVISHVAPVGIRAAAPALGYASNGLIGNGLVGNGLIGNGLLGKGVVAGASVAGLGLGGGLIRAPAVAHGAAQSAVINHVAPVGIRAAAPVALAAPALGYAGNGIIGNGLVGNGLVGNGLLGKGVVAGAPLAIGSGLLGAPVAGLGLGLGRGLIGAAGVAHGATQSAVINHVAPVGIRAAAPIAIASPALGYAGNGLIGNGLVGNGLVGNGLVGSGLIGNGLVGNGLIGTGLLGKGVVAGAPLAIGSGLLGAPVASLGLGLGKALL